MWPLKLDMTRDESRGMLRRLELDTYSSVMSTFRAQGALCKEKARILEELRRLLHISQDRHKAEARRVANDERLTTVAEIISGPNSTQDWSREGRRTFPILPRTAPYTALSYIANTVCEQITRENTKLPHPFETSQNRLQKEQEEEERKQKLLAEQQQQQKQAQMVAPIEIKEEEDEPMVAEKVPAAAVSESVPPPAPPVVTADPFVEAANKSYINNDLKRSYPIPEPSPSIYSQDPIDEDSPLRKKPQLYQELQKQEPPLMSPQSPIVTFHPQFPPQIPQGPMSPHKNLTSPNNNNFAMSAAVAAVPQNFNNNSNVNNNFNPKPAQGRNSNKNTERARKTSVSKKNQNKTKTPYQSNKQGGGKANKNSIAQQQMQQNQMMPIAAPGKGQGGKGNNSSNSPHLIHSYASPLLPYEIPQQQPLLVGATAEIPHEPLQLQKHLTSNAVYQPNQQTQQYGMTPIKSAPYSTPYQQPMAVPNPVYGQQHQILPSSKKDIQYNLTKLNPTNSGGSSSMKNNVNIPLKQSGGSSSLMQGKGHPLFNYQKKSPSKNVLIPTSSAAAALASLGIPKTIQPRKDVPMASKFREPDPSINPADIPNPKIIFSTSHHQEPPAIAPKSSGSQITILDQITLHPPHTIVPSTSAGTGLTITPSQTIVPVTHITPAVPSSSPGTSPLAGGKVITPPIGTIPANKLVTIKGPNLAGFTPVKSGSKLSVHKLQLMPISSQPGGTKNNVIVLPAKSGTLNPGQKITIPRSSVTSVVDPATIISPPKVIVQQQPDLNNIVVLDLASEQNKLKSTTPKSVITEDTPVDIVSTPLDVVTGAVKLQELKGFLSPASSSGTSTTASPLTEKMVKPQPLNSHASKATKFEADSTAPGPSVVPIPKKTKANHQPRGSTSVAALSKKAKATTAAASSTTPAGSDPNPAARNPVMSSSTDWELELDQANQATNIKQTPNPPPKATQKSHPKSSTIPLTTPLPKPIPPSTVVSRKAPQPLSSSSISSTSSNASSPVVVEQIVSSDVVVVPRIAATQRTPVVPSTPALAIAPQQPPVTPPQVQVHAQKVVLPAAITTASPPNERSSDDTSATDSANAEEDPDPEYPAFREATSESDDDYEHFNAVIEEDPDPEDAEEIHGERVEIVNVGYDTSRALIADLEDTSRGTPTTIGGATSASGAAIIVDEDDRNGGTTTTVINPSSMNFVQYIEEADVVGGTELVVEGESTSGAAANGTRNITFEMVEIDADGNKHARTMSYEEALAEGHITTEEEEVKGAGSSGGSSGLVKGKTKS